MTADQRARLAALVAAIDDTAAERIADLDPAVALAVGVIVSQGRSEPEWLYDQAHRMAAISAALIAFVDGRAIEPDPEVPPLVREAIERAAASIA